MRQKLLLTQITMTKLASGVARTEMTETTATTSPRGIFLGQKTGFVQLLTRVPRMGFMCARSQLRNAVLRTK